jgi:hypothetical protein
MQLVDWLEWVLRCLQRLAIGMHRTVGAHEMSFCMPGCYLCMCSNDKVSRKHVFVIEKQSLCCPSKYAIVPTRIYTLLARLVLLRVHAPQADAI